MQTDPFSHFRRKVLIPNGEASQVITSTKEILPVVSTLPWKDLRLPSDDTTCVGAIPV